MTMNLIERETTAVCTTCESWVHFVFIFIPDENEWWGRCPLCDEMYSADFQEVERPSTLETISTDTIENANSFWTYIDGEN